MDEKIYVITAGYYSDYHIISATTDYEKAVALKEKFTTRWDEARIEEYADADFKLQKIWKIHFSPSGNVWDVDYCGSAWQFENIDLNNVTSTLEGRLRVDVVADDEETAVKIAAEKRAQYLAEKMGL